MSPLNLKSIACLAMAGFLTGCAGPMLKPSNLMQASVPNEKEKAPAEEYRLKAGDELAIKFYYQKELNEEEFIRPDGKITLQLIGDVQAANLTPSELARLISDQYKKIIKQYQATVIVRRTVQDKVFVGGEVRQPGTLPFSANTTALQALFQSGGFLDTGEISTVMLIRQSRGGKPQVYSVDLRDPANDFVLLPFDVLYVPRSAIASANLFVNQYIDRLIPISRNLGFSFVYDLSRLGIGQY